jgi:hypothetical protein
MPIVTNSPQNPLSSLSASPAIGFLKHVPGGGGDRVISLPRGAVPVPLLQPTSGVSSASVISRSNEYLSVSSLDGALRLCTIGSHEGGSGDSKVIFFSYFYFYFVC